MRTIVWVGRSRGHTGEGGRPSGITTEVPCVMGGGAPGPSAVRPRVRESAEPGLGQGDGCGLLVGGGVARVGRVNGGGPAGSRVRLSGRSVGCPGQRMAGEMARFGGPGEAVIVGGSREAARVGSPGEAVIVGGPGEAEGFSVIGG